MLEKDRPASLKPHPGGREGRTSQEVRHTTEVSLDGQPWPWVEALVTTLLQGALQFSRCTLKVTETQDATCVTHVLTVHEHGGHQGWSPPSARPAAAAAHLPSPGPSWVLWNGRTYVLERGAAQQKSGAGIFFF